MSLRKWLADFEVISEVSLASNISESGITFQGNPPGAYIVQIKNLESTPGIIDPTLSVQIILDGEEWEEAYDRAIKHLLEILDCLTLTFNSRIKRRKSRRMINWTPGLVQRECILFQEFADPNIPYPIFNDSYLKTVNFFLHCKKDETLTLAIRWYRKALMAETTAETFQYFWFALETLAERDKPDIRVPDLCPKCRKPLYCEDCKKVPEHRPYPKQAIEALIKSVVKGNFEQFFDMSQKIRHALMHGENIQNFGKENNVDINKVRDDLGKVVWGAIFNQIGKCERESKIEAELPFFTKTSYSRQRPGVAIVAKITATRLGADILNPKIEDFAFPPFNVSMMVRDKEDSFEGEREHKPID